MTDGSALYPGSTVVMLPTAGLSFQDAYDHTRNPDRCFVAKANGTFRYKNGLDVPFAPIWWMRQDPPTQDMLVFMLPTSAVDLAEKTSFRSSIATLMYDAQEQMLTLVSDCSDIVEGHHVRWSGSRAISWVDSCGVDDRQALRAQLALLTDLVRSRRFVNRVVDFLAQLRAILTVVKNADQILGSIMPNEWLTAFEEGLTRSPEPPLMELPDLQDVPPVSSEVVGGSAEGSRSGVEVGGSVSPPPPASPPLSPPLSPPPLVRLDEDGPPPRPQPEPTELRSKDVRRSTRRTQEPSSPLDDLVHDRVTVFDPKNEGSAFLLHPMTCMVLDGNQIDAQFRTPRAYRLVNYHGVQGNDVCTQAYASVGSDVCDVLLIATHLDHLRKGNASALMRVLTDFCVSIGCTQMVACVTAGNKTARQFWESRGFVQGVPRRDIVRFEKVTCLVHNLRKRKKR